MRSSMFHVVIILVSSGAKVSVIELFYATDHTASLDVSNFSKKFTHIHFPLLYNDNDNDNDNERILLRHKHINPFLTRFFAITSPIKTVFFDNSVTLKTVLICVYRTN